MQKLQLIGGAVCLSGVLVAIATEQPTLTVIIMSVFGVVLIVRGLIGDNP